MRTTRVSCWLLMAPPAVMIAVLFDGLMDNAKEKRRGH